MQTVEVSQTTDGWLVDVQDGPQFTYGRLTDALQRASRELEVVGSSPSVVYDFTDDFMREARALADDRRVHAEETKRLSKRTDQMIVSLAKQGLTNGDIAAVLGITTARISQIVQDTAEWLWGKDNPSGEIQFAKIQFGRGWVAARGKGPLPDQLEFAGETYVRSGGATSVNGQPWRHTYVPAP